MVVPAHAQFGGITFDPTQSAHAIQQIVNEEKGLAAQATQISQGSQQNLTLIQTLSQDIQMAETSLNIYKQTVTTYNTIFNNLKYFNSKQIWNTAENTLLHSTVQNTYGETAGLQSQLNGQSQNCKPCLEDHEPCHLRYIVGLLEPRDRWTKPAAFYPRSHRGNGCRIQSVPRRKRSLPSQQNGESCGQHRPQYVDLRHERRHQQRSRTAQFAERLQCAT